MHSGCAPVLAVALALHPAAPALALHCLCSMLLSILSLSVIMILLIPNHFSDLSTIIIMFLSIYSSMLGSAKTPVQFNGSPDFCLSFFIPCSSRAGVIECGSPAVPYLWTSTVYFTVLKLPLSTVESYARRSLYPFWYVCKHFISPTATVVLSN